MTVTRTPTLVGELAGEAWKLYNLAFSDLETLAANQHLMTADAFDQMMADPRIDKYLTTNDEGVLVGLATYTRDLGAVSLVAPRFYEHRWPEQYARGAIWYILFLAVHPDHRTSDAFHQVFAELYKVAEAEDGLVSMDICQHNDDANRLGRIIGLLLRRMSGGRSKSAAVDKQTFWVFDMRGETL